MQRLKVITTALFLFGLIMAMGFPAILLRNPGPKSSPHDRQTFLIVITVYFVILLIVLTLVMIYAWKVYRLQQEELAEKRMENLKELIEGTLTDHSKKENDA
jgi:hypothetical protein